MRNAEARKKERETQAEQEKAELEAKLVKKAIALKKRQIKKQQLLDDIPDDDDDERSYAPASSLMQKGERLSRINDEPIEKTKTKPAHAKPNTDNITSSINKYRFV